MISILNKYKNPILIITILFFVGSLGFVGAGVFMEEYGPNAAIAKVDGESIKYKDFLRNVDLLSQEARNQEDFDENAEKDLRQQVLQSMISQLSLAQAAQQFGIGVSDLEIGYAIKSAPVFNVGGGFNKDAYIWVVRNQFHMNPAEYEAQLKREKLASKFQNALILAAKVTPQEEKILKEESDKALAKEKKGKKTSKKDEESANAALSLAAIQLKAQDLLAAYSDKINADNKIRIFKKD